MAVLQLHTFFQTQLATFPTALRHLPRINSQPRLFLPVLRHVRPEPLIGTGNDLIENGVI
jgi:hypothetical protein